MIDHRVSTLKEKIVSITKFGLLLSFGFLLLLESGDRVVAQEEGHIHVIVNMVQLNVAVTDKNGNYITGLTPKDFVITEDGIPQKLATFGEGNGPAHSLMAAGDPKPEPAAADIVEQASTRTSLLDPRETLN